MRPYVGRNPTVPHATLGETIEPSVSVPSVNPTSPAAVELADPALDPLDVASVFQGVLVIPLNHRPPCASAPIESLAIRTAPALRSRSTTVASLSGTRVWYGSAPNVVRMPLVSNRSLRPKGIPCSGPRYLPARIS